MKCLALQCHLLEFLYQSEVEVAETVVAVLGYLERNTTGGYMFKI